MVKTGFGIVPSMPYRPKGCGMAKKTVEHFCMITFASSRQCISP